MQPGWIHPGRMMIMANSNDGKFQKNDENTKNAAKKGGESSRSGSQGASGNKSSGKSENRSSSKS
jgi:hypothetical protein